MASASPSPAPDQLDAAARKAVLAASAPWLAALLNLVPGLGSGYDRRARSADRSGGPAAAGGGHHGRGLPGGPQGTHGLKPAAI
jgi:hypothetical protein